MDRIRHWMRDHPHEARELRRQNKSFVFFRTTGLADEGEAVGAQGVALTPRPLDRGRQGDARLRHAVLHRGRAADRQRRPSTPFRRLMIAQDTGSAIVGPARADIFWRRR